MFGAFVVKKWHFPPESPEFRRKVAEFRRKVAEFRPEFPEFRFLNLNSPSVRKMRFSAEFRPEFRFRWSAGFVKKTKRWTLSTAREIFRCSCDKWHGPCEAALAPACPPSCLLGLGPSRILVSWMERDREYMHRDKYANASPRFVLRLPLQSVSWKRNGDFFFW